VVLDLVHERLVRDEEVPALVPDREDDRPREVFGEALGLLLTGGVALLWRACM
jgi:hypothetical protein